MPIDKESTANPKTAVTLDQRGGSVFWAAKLGSARSATSRFAKAETNHARVPQPAFQKTLRGKERRIYEFTRIDSSLLKLVTISVIRVSLFLLLSVIS